MQDVLPRGMIDSGRQILVRFDGDMTSLGRTDAPSPVTIKCSPSITFPAPGRWVNPREWAMAMPPTLAAGLQCQISLSEGLKDLAGDLVKAETRAWSFNTGSVRIVRTWPHLHNEIREHQIFLLSLNAPVTAAGIEHHLSCQFSDGSRSAIELVDDASFRRAWALTVSASEPAPPQSHTASSSSASRPTLGVRCARAAPASTALRLVLRPGLPLNGIVHSAEQSISFRVQSAFKVALTCSTQTGVDGCDFRQSVRLRMTAWVIPSDLPTLRLSDGTVLQAKPNIQSWQSGKTLEFIFEGPFKVFGQATVNLPPNLVDEEGRYLDNAAEFPKRILIADAPAYLGMLQAHGTVSTRQGQAYWPIAVRKLEAELPVRIRRLHHQDSQASALASSLTALVRDNSTAQFSGHSLRRIDEEFERVYASKLSSTTLSLRTTQSEMEFIPIPLTEPGIYVIEADSARYRAHQAAVERDRSDTTVALWGRRAIVQVTNLNAGIRVGQHGNSLIWVTALDSGKAVPNATLSLLDCAGTVLWQGRSDDKGMAWVTTTLTSKRCEQSAVSLGNASPRERLHTDSTLTLVTQLDNDIVTVPVRAQSPEQVVLGAGHLAHVLLDRSLFKAAEVVSMQVHFRWLNAKGITLPSPPSVQQMFASVRDPAGQELTKLALELNSQGDASLQWTLPTNAKLGQYRVQISAQSGSNQFTVGNASFQVEEFRTPVFDAKLSAASAWTAAQQQLQVGAALSYLSGGSAAKERVLLRGVYQNGVAAPLPGFDFNGASKAIAPLPISDSGVLDAQGTWSKTLQLPKVAVAATLNLEMQFSDPNGEVQTVATAATVWPHETRPGLRLIGAHDSESKPMVEAVLLDAMNKPLVGRKIALQATVSPTSRSNASDSTQELTTPVCEALTDAQGRLRCPVPIPIRDRNERLTISMTAPDRVDTTQAKPMLFSHESSTWVLRWQRPQHELTVIEQAPYQQGQTIRVLAEPPRLPASALITVEREGVLSAAVHQIERIGQVVDLLLQEHFAPNVRVQVRYVMPETADNQAVSLERSRLLKIEPLSYLLKVVVTPAQAQIRTRSQLPVTVQVTDKRSGLPAAQSRLTIAVVDEGLLALRSNSTWNFVEAMLRDRPVLVGGYWLDRHLTTRAAIGPRPTHLPAEEARAQQVAMPKAMSAAPAPTSSAPRRLQEADGLANASGGATQPSARSDFSSLLIWKTDITTDANGQASLTVPTNDALSRFRIVVLSTQGAERFGEGSASFQTTQALQLISGLPPQVRADDRVVQSFTIRNTSAQVITVLATARAESLSTTTRILNAQTRRARGLEVEQRMTLKAGENRVITWPLHVPSQTGQLRWQLEARADSGNETLQDAVSILQIVNEAVPVTTRQATLLQVERDARIPYEQPTKALPLAGGVSITLQRSLVDAALTETMDWMRRYPYSCLEQQTSRYSTLNDQVAWEQLMQKLPQYLSGNGLANYFPVAGTGSTSSGSESLTAYVLDMAHAKGWSIPQAERSRMLDGLLAIQAGRGEALDWAPSRYQLERQLSAQATLALYDHKRAEQRTVTPQALRDLPSMALVDWIRFLLSQNSVTPNAHKAALLDQASKELRGRFDFQGTKMRWRNEQAEYWWWFMWNGDSVAARAALVAEQLGHHSPLWRDDAPRVIAGLIGRQSSGRWSTTVANAWSAQALRQFARVREAVSIEGVTRAALLPPPGSTSSTSELTHEWKEGEPRSPELLLAWPQHGAKGQVQLTHDGKGAPWATVAIKAAVRTVSPVSAGLSIRRVVTAVERKTANQWHVGDIIRVRLDMTSDANNTWVVVRDSIPSGATILGRGLGRESGLAQQGERSLGWTWPSYVERATESYRAYFRWVPQGQWSTEYTLRLNNAGEFQLPAARIEAMYAPEIFGEVPAARLVVLP